MSIRIMSKVWESGIDDKGELLVMLALADFANDKGECWPSIATIAQKARMTPRSVQRVCRSLEASGALEISTATARAGCNMYLLTPDARVTPDTMSPLTRKTSPPDTKDTPPLTPASPEPSLIRQEPSRVYKRDPLQDALTAWASEGAVASFIAYRKKTKRNALTETAAKRLAETLKAIFNAGGDPDDALGMAEERGWLTVKADWYFKEKGQQHGNRNDYAQPSPSHGAGMARGTTAAEIADFGIRWAEGRAARGGTSGDP